MNKYNKFKESFFQIEIIYNMLKYLKFVSLYYYVIETLIFHKPNILKM